jgi:hypothetical protein
MPLPTPTQLTIYHHEYPGQPLVSAACIVQLYESPEAAAERSPHGWFVAEGNANIPGAGGQATKAVIALLNYREHGSIDQVIEELHDGWRRTVHPGNFHDRLEPGMEKAKAIEPKLRKVLEVWLNK